MAIEEGLSSIPEIQSTSSLDRLSASRNQGGLSEGPLVVVFDDVFDDVIFSDDADAEVATTKTIHIVSLAKFHQLI